ncbi:hypothetical protein U5U50_00795 [Mycoplasma sp. 888]|uniref:DNA-directed RNA polymerase subunit delta n=1 Tax=Mycoplasma sp. 888 TaxID=3108483 RepID=UPI002D79EA51|nr:hypothetical protein [Mycoplasma sp. 888]WRQ25925.1 hypothetical protein U5U50_00795 [Mycoplasma sp. 888]
MYKTMLEIAYELVSSRPTDEFAFMEIFNTVEDELRYDWEDRFVTMNTPYEKVRERKIGELYRLLTVDKRFNRLANGNWEARNI